MHYDRPDTSPRPLALPWMLLLLVLAGSVGYIFRVPLTNAFGLLPEQRPGLSTGGVLTSIRSLSNLESVVMHYQVLVRETRDGNPLLLRMDKQRALIVADGAVTAGVDLEGLSQDDVRVSEDGKVVRITLPPAKLLSVNVMKLYTEDVDTGLFGLLPADPTLHDTALVSAQVKMRTLACDSNILELASVNAERSVERLFTLMGDIEVLVESQPGSRCEVES